MNDLESRLRSLTFREPPPGWRGSIVSVTSERGWQEWLAPPPPASGALGAALLARAPHPAAWVARAAIWLVLALVSQTFERPVESAPTPTIAASRNADPQSEPTLLAFH